MNKNSEKESLRKVILEKRDNTSAEMRKILSEKIRKNLKKIEIFKKARTVGLYFPINSEVLTHDIMQETLSEGKTLVLPKVDGDALSFFEIKGLEDLQKGSFGIMEPKDNCKKSNQMDIIIIPSVGISEDGGRLGYGYGYYDRFLKNFDKPVLTLAYEKQLVKRIPQEENDVAVDWIITEKRIIKSS